MNLAIDIGNTVAKAAVFESNQMIETFKSEKADSSFVESIIKAYPGIQNAILVSSRIDDEGAERTVKERIKNYMRFDTSVKVPIKNLYGTPETLGPDRLAGAVGANALYPDSNVLIVDFGTAITIDVITKKGEFIGGNISPGATTRFHALHDYTSRLPLRSLTEEVPLVADSSNTAIESGVINGIIFEIEGYISRLSKEYEGLRIIFTGGDGNFFAKRLKNTIFATYDLVIYGLNRILEYNAK